MLVVDLVTFGSVSNADPFPFVDLVSVSFGVSFIFVFIFYFILIFYFLFFIFYLLIYFNNYFFIFHFFICTFLQIIYFSIWLKTQRDLLLLDMSYSRKMLMRTSHKPSMTPCHVDSSWKKTNMFFLITVLQENPPT